MEINLEKSKLIAPMFDGRGFMAAGHFESECRLSYADAAVEPTNFYLSRDAVLVILQWVKMWELHLQSDSGPKMSSTELNINDVIFVLYSRADYDYTDLNELHHTQAAHIFDTVRQNFATGFTERENLWEQGNHPLGSCSAESYNVPGRRMEFTFDNNSVHYNYRIVGQPVPTPYASLDLSMINVADALLSIADTQTYPTAGYELELKLGFGNQKLADLTRSQLRELASRLIP